MEVVICGAGEVGRHSAEVLASRGHSVTIIDLSQDRLEQVEATMDVRTMVGNGAQANVLNQVGAGKADLLIAASNIDEVNLLSSSVAKGLGCKMAIARVHHRVYIERQGLDYSSHLGIDHLVCPEWTTARAIAAVLRVPGASAVESLARGLVEMNRIEVSDDAKAVGKALRELNLTGARVAALERGEDALLPRAETVFEPGDEVSIIGERKHFDKARKLFTTEAGKRRKIVIMGGSTQSVWLCRELRSRNLNVRLIVSREHRAVELSEKLDWVTVIHADVIQSDVLHEERIDQADAFVSATDDEETNILAAARAKTMGVKQALCVLQRPTYLHLLRHIGIDHSFSSRSTAVEEILRLLDLGVVRRIATLADGVADVYEVRVRKSAEATVGQPLMNVELPSDCLIAAIQREDGVIVPAGKDTLKYGDTAVVIGPSDALRPLTKMFGD